VRTRIALPLVAMLLAALPAIAGDSFPETEYRSGKAGFVKTIKGTLIVEEKELRFEADGALVFTIPVEAIVNVNIEAKRVQKTNWGLKGGPTKWVTEEILQLDTKGAQGTETLTFKTKTGQSEAIKAKIATIAGPGKVPPAGQAVARAQPGENVLYLFKAGGDRIEVVDGVSLDSMPDIPTQRLQDANWLVLPGGLRVYYPNASETGVDVVNLLERRVERTIPCAKVKRLTILGDRRHVLAVADAGVTIIDGTTHQVDRSLTFAAAGAHLIFSNGDGTVVVVTTPPAMTRKNKPCADCSVYDKDVVVTAKARFDIYAGSEPLSVQVDGQPSQTVLSPDSRWVYVQDDGDEKKKIEGRVLAIETATGRVTNSFSVGTQLSSFATDPRSGGVLLASRPDMGAPGGYLYEFRDGQRTQAVAIGEYPRRLTFLGPESTLCALSYSDLRCFRTGLRDAPNIIPLNGLEKGPDPAMPIGGVPRYVFSVAGGRRAVVSVSGGNTPNKVALLNLEENRVQAVVKAGRTGTSFLKGLGKAALAGAATGASQAQGRQAAQASGSRYYTYTQYSFVPQSGEIFFQTSSDGGQLYVLNTETRDVTVIDTKSGAVVEMIPFKGLSAIDRVAGGQALASHDGTSLWVMGVTDRKVNEAFKLGDGWFYDIVEDEANGRVMLTADDMIVAVDPLAGRTVREIASLGATQMILGWTKKGYWYSICSGDSGWRTRVGVTPYAVEGGAQK
jgi:DNA-binding beta-propeller fold protein YncE